MSALAWVKQTVRNLLSRAEASADPGDTPAAAAGNAATPPTTGPPADPFKETTDKTIVTLTWLIGALAAIATLVVAGTQLSSIGELSQGQGLRLGFAIAAAAAALTGTIAAIGVVTWARLPGEPADLARLEEIAATAHPRRRGRDKRASWLLKRVAADPGFHKGTKSMSALIDQMKTTDQEYYAALARVQEEKTAAAAADDPKAGKKPITKAQATLDVIAAQDMRLRAGLQMSAHLLRYIEFRHRVTVAIGVVLALSVVIAGALVGLAWAANPPEEESTSPAVAARLAHARLFLASTAKIWDARLGAECAGEARTSGGIEVVALASDDDSTTVVTIPSDQCPEPRSVIVPGDDGAVIEVSDAPSTAPHGD